MNGTSVGTTVTRRRSPIAQAPPRPSAASTISVAVATGACRSGRPSQLVERVRADADREEEGAERGSRGGRGGTTGAAAAPSAT